MNISQLDYRLGLRGTSSAEWIRKTGNQRRTSPPPFPPYANDAVTSLPPSHEAHQPSLNAFPRFALRAFPSSTVDSVRLYIFFFPSRTPEAIVQCSLPPPSKHPSLL